MTNNLGDTNSIIDKFVAQLRSAKIQTDSMRFRKNMERIGEVMAYEISKTLEYDLVEVETPLGIARCHHPSDKVVLGTILRAGLPFHSGMLNFFDDAENAFISAYRHHHKDGTFDINVEYVNCPDLDDKVLILCDPMVATGASIQFALKELLTRGTPKAIHVATIIGSRDGIGFISRRISKSIHIWTAAIDEELTAKSYIVPGLGDAGDLSFGEKAH